MSNKYKQIIKELRSKNKFSQEVVARAIGVSRPTYVGLESGKQELNIEEAKKLANFYSIGVDALLAGHLPDIEKYKHMILFYLRLGLTDKNDGKVPKTKLAKLLYLADFAWYYDHLKSMSGMQYRKITFGPVPDTFFRALDELEESGKIIIEKKNNDDKVIFLISEADSNKNESIETLSEDEKNFIVEVASKWQRKKTSDIVNFTHNQLPYRLCRNDELIPYELITQENPGDVY